MACWNIQITDENGKAGVVKTIPAISTQVTWKNLLNDVSQSEESKEIFKDIIIQAKQNQKLFMQKQKENPKLQIQQPKLPNALYQIKLNLESLGIQMEIKSSDEMRQKFGKNSNGKTVFAGVEDGIIYVNKSASVTAPIHELMHIVLAVMKSKNYQEYQKLMEELQKSYIIDNGKKIYIFKQQYDEVNGDDSQYKNFTESDKIEETFCRIIEQILSDKSKIKLDNFSLSTGENVYDLLDEVLIPYINQAFGTNLKSRSLNFLRSVMSDLPLSSDLFRDIDIETNGYKNQQQSVLTYGKVMNYIKELLNPNDPKLIEGDCE